MNKANNKVETKTMKLTFHQGDQVFTNSIDYVTDNELSRSHAIGTVLSEFIDLIYLKKVTGSKLFNQSKPINIRVESDVITFDTVNISQAFSDRLKIQSNAKSARRFAKRVHAIAMYLTRDIVLTSYEDLIQGLDELIAE